MSAFYCRCFEWSANIDKMEIDWGKVAYFHYCPYCGNKVQYVDDRYRVDAPVPQFRGYGQTKERRAEWLAKVNPERPEAEKP